ncbi:MAG: TRAP transporter substrate-binding protein DctP, partial [Chloroflexota bacterium]
MHQSTIAYHDLAIFRSRNYPSFKIEYYWGGSLLKSNEILKGVAAGIADTGMIYTGYNPSELPLLNATEVFPTVKATLPQTKQVYDKIRRDMPGDWDKVWSNLDLVCIGISPLMPATMVSRAPVRVLEDFKGMKIRIGSAVAGKAYEAVGAVPVFISLTETRESLASGLVDGAVYGSHIHVQYGLVDSTSYYNPLMTLYPGTGAYIMNRNTWNKLTPDIQKVILQVFSEAEGRTIDFMLNQLSGIEAQIAAKGLETVGLESGELQRWTNLSAVRQMR